MDSPKVSAALIGAIGTDKWQTFQVKVLRIKLHLTWLQTKLGEVKHEELSAIQAACTAEERALIAGKLAWLQEQGQLKLAWDVHIVMIVGVEAVNVNLYGRVAQQVNHSYP